MRRPNIGKTDSGKVWIELKDEHGETDGALLDLEHEEVTALAAALNDRQNCGCGGITPKVWPVQLPDEVYVVTQNRSDGTQPKVCKTIGQQWFAMEAEARRFADEMNARDGVECYGAYRAHVTILDRL